MAPINQVDQRVVTDQTEDAANLQIINETNDENNF